MLKGARALVERVLGTAPPKTAVFCHLSTGETITPAHLCSPLWYPTGVSVAALCSPARTGRATLNHPPPSSAPPRNKLRANQRAYSFGRDESPDLAPSIDLVVGRLSGCLMGYTLRSHTAG